MEVLDWPSPVDAAVSAKKRGHQIEKDRTREIEVTEDMIVAWIEGRPDLDPPDCREVYAAGQDILRTAIRRVTDGAYSYYAIYPARPREKGAPLFIGNCAGFVELCFEKAGFDIVQDLETSLPAWSIEEICVVAPDLLREPHGNSRLERWVTYYFKWLTRKEPPYRLFLAGYQLSAFRDDQYGRCPSSATEAFWLP